MYTLMTAWKFIFIVPELADHLRQNALPKVQEAVDRYKRMAPYWSLWAKSPSLIGTAGRGPACPVVWNPGAKLPPGTRLGTE
jgi:hypothetical protein